MNRPTLRLLACAAALLVATVPLAAASLDIGPTRVQMIGPERTTTLTLRNSGTDPITVQIRAVDWSQNAAGDDYAPSATLVASPPLAQIAPGESQVVRVVIENLDELSAERAFRLILDEIPANRPGSGAGVQAALRALVPVFVTPSTQSRPRLSWSAVRGGDTVHVTAQNQGETRERLLGMRVSAGGTELAGRIEGYVLSGASRTWAVPAPAGASSLRIAGEGEFGAIEVDVPIAS